jgi:hypothetical protein
MLCNRIGGAGAAGQHALSAGQLAQHTGASAVQHSTGINYIVSLLHWMRWQLTPYVAHVAAQQRFSRGGQFVSWLSTQQLLLYSIGQI